MASRRRTPPPKRPRKPAKQPARAKAKKTSGAKAKATPQEAQGSAESTQGGAQETEIGRHEGAPAARPARRRLGWRIAKWSAVFVLWLAVLGAAFVAYYAHDLPDTEHLTGPETPLSITVLAADGSEGRHGGRDVGRAGTGPGDGDGAAASGARESRTAVSTYTAGSTPLA